MSSTAGLAEKYKPSVLHVGCGPTNLPEWLGACDETRLDANPAVSPDIVANMTSLGDIGPYDSVFCSHALEHLCPRDVLIALGEFNRVLRPGGTAVVMVPDLEDVKPTWDVVYDSPAGPITGHDMYYGHTAMSEDNPFMRHLSGFVKDSLESAFTQAGFTSVSVTRMAGFNLCAIGVK